jgi:hypothetical protein
VHDVGVPRQLEREPLLDRELAACFVVARQVRVQALECHRRRPRPPDLAEAADGDERVELPVAEAFRHTRRPYHLR